jgi:PKD repeat protein
MTEDNNAYATLYEQQIGNIGYITYFFDIEFIFRNVNFNHEVVELHIVLHDQPRDILNVLVGSSPNPSNNVGIINRRGDNVFDVKSLIQNPDFYVKIIDSSSNNYGPYFIERMYLLIADLNTPPSVDAGIDQVVNEGEIIHYNGSFTDPEVSDTHTIKWDFGDGLTATGTLTPNHIYKENGIYIVTLTVTDNHGGIGSDNLIVTVNNVAPIVNATEDQFTQEGTKISLVLATFTNQGELDTHTAIIDWGDGTIDAGNVTEPLVPIMSISLQQNNIEGEGTVSGAHTYGDNGIYTVIVNVTDDDQGVGSDSLFISVSNTEPVVFAGDDKVVNEGDAINFNGDFYDPGVLDTYTVEWDFGDGLSASETLTPTHTYGDNGIYLVTLTVTDDDGGVGSDNLTIVVNNVAPVVIIGDDQIINEGDAVIFNGNFQDSGDLDTHIIEWDFGDGFSATGTLTPTHIYEDNGIYLVTLTVTDDDGAISSDNLTIVVNNVAPVVSVGEDQVIDEGDAVNFNGDFYDPGVLDTHIIEWDFGDGFGTTGTLTPTHTYGDNGIYLVTLTVTDDDGAISSDNLTIIVNNVAPVVSVGEDQVINEGDAVSFNGDFYDPGVLDTFIIEWDFGDGFSASETLTPTHTYGDNGIYTVVLTITDNDGGVGSNALLITVNNIAPSVNISKIEVSPNSINTTGNAYDPGSDDLTFIWDWGDGSSNTITNYLNDLLSFPVEIEETVEHLYNLSSEFIITLTVMDDDGGIGTDSINVKLTSPRDLKIEAILNLEQIKTGNKCFNKKIDHIIKFIEKSLCERLWLNSTHLDPKCGCLVFIFEMIAIRFFEKFILTESNAYILEKLIRADKMLAAFALEDAKNANVINLKFQEKYEFCVLKSEQHLNEALMKYESKEYICTIFHFLISWKYAQIAIKWANKAYHCCKC